MTVCYIANTTRQHRELYYRIQGSPQLYTVHIPAGEQRTLPHTELTESEVRQIMESVAMYGVVDEKEVPNMRRYVGLCFKIGGKIDMRRIVAAIEKNDAIAKETAEKAVSENLIAANHHVRTVTADSGSVSTLEVVEQTRPDSKDKGVKMQRKVEGNKHDQLGAR